MLALAGYDGMAAHHAMVADRRELVEVKGVDLIELVREARAGVKLPVVAAVVPRHR